MHVLILNLGGQEVLKTTSVKHAHKMLHRGVARVHTWADEDAYGGYGIPRSVELTKYHFAHWKYDGHPHRRDKVFSKKGVLRRDGYQCAYCNGNKATTIDHLLPRARGGKSTWLNCVAACQPCNSRKADKLLEDSGLTLLSPPYDPNV
jgi:hypothetical protein